MHVMLNHCGMWTLNVAYKHAYCTHKNIEFRGYFIIIFGIQDLRLMYCGVLNLDHDHY